MPRFCPECGAKIKEGYKFCGKCGYKTTQDVVPIKEEKPIIKSDAEIIKKSEPVEEKKTKIKIEKIKPEKVKEVVKPKKSEPSKEKIISTAEKSIQPTDYKKQNNKKKYVIAAIIIIAILIIVVIGAYNATRPSESYTGDTSNGGSSNPPVSSDTDGDGYNDNVDAFPSDSTQWYDRDGDHYGDNLNGNNPDLFPDNPSEWKDTDRDGYGDNSDAFPSDSTQWSDLDGDHYGDNLNGNNADKFPNDPSEWKDNDNDGIGDNADIDDDNDGYTDTVDYLPNENAVIKVTISKFKVIDEVDGWPDNSSKAQIYFDIYIDDMNTVLGRLPSSGEWDVDRDDLLTVNQYIVYDIPDDAQMHSIKIIMYDKDFIGSESLDIDGIHTGSNQNALTLQYDIVTETWSGDNSNGISDGSNDGTLNTDDNDAYLEYDITLL